MSQSVDSLLSQLRTQLDELNTENVTDAHLLQALNRAQRAATNVVSRKYDSMFWESTTTTTVAGQREYDIPADAHGKRVELVEVLVGSVTYELRRIGNHKRSQYTSTSQSDVPTFYSLKKNKIEIYPLPSAGLTLTIHYTKRPEELVLSEGRVTTVNSGSNFVIVDALGDNISTTSTGFNCYINVIDYETGAIRGTLQVSALDTTLNKVTFKSSGLTRSEVLGRTVSTSLPTDISVDDYLAVVTGTAVAELDDAYIDYLLQYAVVEIKRRFGEPIQEELAALSALEKELDNIWSGREASFKVRRANSHYSKTNIRRALIR
jgi:hypothetical protein